MANVERLIIIAAIILIPLVIWQVNATKQSNLTDRLIRNSWTSDNSYQKLTFSQNFTGQWKIERLEETTDFEWKVALFGERFIITTDEKTYTGEAEVGKITLAPISNGKKLVFYSQL